MLKSVRILKGNLVEYDIINATLRNKIYVDFYKLYIHM